MNMIDTNKILEIINKFNVQYPLIKFTYNINSNIIYIYLLMHENILAKRYKVSLNYDSSDKLYIVLDMCVKEIENEIQEVK